MANQRNTYQQVNTISVPREKILEIASDIEFGKNDFRVFLILLTQLEGYSLPKNLRADHKDPMNFKMIDLGQISDTLNLSKKKVKKSINYLLDEGLLEEGYNETVSSGYRFTF